MKCFQKLLALTLSLLLTAGIVQPRLFARAEDKKPDVLHTERGDVAVTDDWETRFPYGTFAFELSEAALEEGGDTLVVNVYRLGGTLGRATAVVRYSPMLVPVGEDEYGYATAVSTDDILIEVENARPIARYQPVGKDPDPEEGNAVILREENGDDLTLSLAAGAGSYQWQVLSDSRWQNVDGATEYSFTAAKADLDDYDFRCVYTVGGTAYCTASAKGAPYEKPEEKPLPEMPEGLDLNPKTQFTALEPDRDDPYLSYDLYLTFADGEWMKSIRITAPEDDAPECIRQGLLMITDCEGGSLYDTANTLIFAVTDNDAPEPFTVSLTQTELSADRADGAAYVTVKRTGGSQSMVSVTYESADGTAKAGKDYEKVTGEVSFYGDAAEQKIVIPLIDDGKEDPDGKEMTLRLIGIKGDAAGVGTLGETEVTVRLYNSGTGEGNNLATVLADPDAIDLSGKTADNGPSAVDIDPATVTGTPKETGEPLAASIAGLDGDLQLQTYHYGRLYVSRYDYNDYESNYWTDDYDVIAAGPSWPNAAKTDNGYKVSSDGSKKATLTIADMAKLYKSFSGEYNFSAGWAEYMSAFDSDSYTYGWGAVTRPNGQNYAYVDCEPWVEKGGFLENDTLHWKSSGTLNAAWSVTESVAGLTIGTTQNGDYTSTNEQYSEITGATLTRRTFTGGFDLLIHTANDGESGGLNVRTAPDGAAVLTAESGVYASMKPTVTLVRNEGGVDWYGDFYVGTRLKVSLNKTVSYAPYAGEELSAAVYVTRRDGSAVNAKVEAVSGTDDYYVTLMWDNLSQSDLASDYVINVVMSRKQDLKIDLSPSVAHMKDADGNVLPSIDASKVGEAEDLFWASGEDYITCGCSPFTAAAPHFGTTVTETRVTKDGGAFSLDGTVLARTGLQNVQWINFNRSHEDRILYNGRSYAGDDRIMLEPADLAQANLTFRYYNKSFLTATSVMTAAIDSVGLYWDGDLNGRIDGAYNPDTGYFEIGAGSGDEFLMFLEPGTDYTETIFTYAENADGGLGQMYLKIFYTMTPRALTPEPGQEGQRAQVLPALTTSVTDPDVYAELTDQQQSYRYVFSGKDETGAYTADGHVMYGAAATAVQYVDVPLGGDTSPVKPVTVNGAQKYEWEPAYRGNLMYPYDTPDPIYIENSLAGKDIPLAPTAAMNDGKLVMSETDRANLNGYLGSFAGDSTVALCVQQQTADTETLALDGVVPRPESSTLIPNSTTPDASYLSQMGSDDPEADGGFDMADSGSDFSEFNLDLNTKIPKLKFGETTHDFISYSSNGLEHLISFSIPLAGWKQGKGWKGPGQMIKGNAQEFKNCLNIYFGPAGLMFSDDSYSDAVEKGKYTSKGFNAVIIFTGAFLFKYDPVYNEFRFKQFSVGAMGFFQFSYTHRFTVCPLFYITVKIGVSLKLSTGGEYKNKTIEGARYVGEDAEKKTMTLTKGRYYVFPLDYKAVNIRFNGKVALDLYEDEACTKRVAGANSGFLKSKGAKPVTATLLMKDGYDFDGKTYYLQVSALENTTLSHLAPVTDQRSDIKWSGIRVEPEFFVSVSGGVGVELMKLELTVKFSAGVVMTFFPASGGNFFFNSAKFTLSLAAKAVFLFYSQSFDLIGYTIKYDGEEKEWSHGWSALGDKYGGSFGTLSMTGADGSVYDARLTLPGDVSRTQTVYAQKDAPDDFSLQSYQANDAAVPFELAGYSGSSDAAKLADGLMTGYDFRLVTAGNENYVIYHIGRENALHANDNTMLVMSRLKMTGVQPGLVNPADENAAVPYIPLDVLANGADDGTGDLSFSAQEENGAVKAVWVSYAEPTAHNEETVLGTLAAAARNTVVKTASFTPGNEGFTPAVTVGSADGAVAMPGFAGDAAVYVGTTPYSDAELAEKTEQYRVYLANQGYDPDDEEEAIAEIASYRIGLQRASWTVNGRQSEIRVSKDGRTVGTVALAEGVHVDNIESAQIGDRYYIAYTTGEEMYTDETGGRTGDAAAASNLLTVKRLYLRTFTVADGEVRWDQDGKAILLRTLYDFDNNDTLSDGVYRDGMRVSRRDDPYFDHLQFLYAKIGDALTGEEEDFTLQTAAPEHFLLFDMNGATYLIREASLVSIADAQSGSVIPFFRADTTGADEEAEAYAATGRSDVTIGVDGNGSLAAVYTATVENTGDNALWLAKYDPNTGSWGSGAILAMNHLGVYEDNIRENRSRDDAEKAFLGLLEGYDGGSLDTFTFSNPQIALGQTADTLLVLTEGAMGYLRENDDPDYPVVPIADEDVTVSAYPQSASKPAGVGVYAIACGVGRQEIGNASLDMPVYDFTAGAEPYAKITFMNTGDVGIRGSAAQPITVELNAQSDSGVSLLGQWTLTENVISGQKVALNGNLSVPTDLPEGTKLVLHVYESDAYVPQGGSAFSAVSEPLLVIGSRPDLGIADVKIRLKDVDGNGSAVLDVDLIAGNYGTAQAADAFVLFSYDTGFTDEDGRTVWAPLDLTGSALEAEDLHLLSVPYGEADGVFALGTVEAGYGKRVTGTITVPAACFNDSATGGLSLRAELYSAADRTGVSDTGLIEGTHGEYNCVNNLFSAQIEHAAVFTAPHRISVPMGNTVRIPVSVRYTTDENEPRVLVSEFSGQDEEHMGVLSFRDGSFSNGVGGGTLALSPRGEGSGFIRLLDANTNSFFDIAYTVTPPSDGINIFNDNELFTFINPDGSFWDGAAASDAQGWLFDGMVPVWGADGTEPYLGNLSKGKPGSSFTFTTQAESIALIFDGTARVESDFEGFSPVEISASGGSGDEQNEYAVVTFGENPDNLSHTVTVTVTGAAGLSGYAWFDRLIETFSEEGGVPVPEDDEDAPHILFSRSFPAAGSVKTGDAVRVQAFVFDNNALASVTLDGKKPASLTKHDDSFWTLDLTVTENGGFTVDAFDDAGHRAVRHVDVDWFGEGDSDGDALPTAEVTLMKRGTDGAADVPLTDEVPYGDGDSAYLDVLAKASDGGDGATVTVTCLYFTDDGASLQNEIAPLPDGTYPADAKGWYLVRVSDPAPHEDRWTLTVARMTRSGSKAPVVLLAVAEDGNALQWSAATQETDSGTMPAIAAVTLNGHPLETEAGMTSLSGVIPVSYGGDYVLEVTDRSGGKGTASCRVTDVPVSVAEGKTQSDLFTVTPVGHVTKGSIGIDPAALTGGYYDPAASDPANGRYAGRYEWLVRSSEDPTPPDELLAASCWTTEPLIENLEAQNYTVYIRDAQDKRNADTFAVFDVTVPADPVTHVWDDGVETVAPTLTSEGVMTYTCTVCGETKTEPIPKLVPPDFTPGDVDDDGLVTAADARLALRRAVDLETYEPGTRAFLAADVDRSGTVTAADARKILRAAVGLEALT